MEKIVRDGKVAVAMSRGAFREWSTSGFVNPMDARFNQLFLDGDLGEVHRILREKGIDHFFTEKEVEGVEIVWVPVGTKFVIMFEDEHEFLYYLEDFDWYEA